jgi:uncharacterized protein YaaN involved in tellurite resistance
MKSSDVVEQRNDPMPLPSQVDVDLADPANAVDPQAVERLVSQISLRDSQAVLAFGSDAQEELTRISDSMLEQVRSKDLGTAGDALNDMVAALRGFDTKQNDSGRPGWLSRLFGWGSDATRMLQRYEKARDQIDAIMDRLDGHQTELMIDIETLDRLYEANLDYFRALELHIAAGERRLAKADEEELPVLERQAAAADQALAAQKLRDARMVRDLLERRVHDLRLTRQVTLQSLPSIRMVQENDKALVARIRSMLVNTVPLWRQQLAQALTIQRARETAATVDAANDLTNELLRANAVNLRDANREARRQAERGVYDIEAVSEANQLLVEAIEEGLRIADEGREARDKAGLELDRLENQLRESLAAASARQVSERGGPQRAA